MLATDKAHQSAPAQQAAAIAAEGAITISTALTAVLADLFTFHVKTKSRSKKLGFGIIGVTWSGVAA